MKNILFSFDDMKAGDAATKRLSQAFARAGANVISTAVDARTKRTAGVTYREVALTFADGQQLTFAVKQTGDVFQAKLNGKVVPLKNPDDHGKAVGELVKAMDAGRGKFQATLAKTRAALPKGIKTAAPKMEVALQEQATALESELAAAEQTRDALKAELGEAAMDSAVLDAAKSTTQLAIENFATVNIRKAGANGKVRMQTDAGEIVVTQGADKSYRYTLNGEQASMNAILAAIKDRRSIKVLDAADGDSADDVDLDAEPEEEDDEDDKGEAKEDDGKGGMFDDVALDAAMSKKDAFEKAIANYVKGGGNEKKGRELLAKEIKEISAKNLPSSLVHWGFAKQGGAEALAAALTSDSAALDGVIEASVHAGVTYYETEKGGVEYMASQKKDGRWEVYTHRKALGRSNIGSVKHYETLEQLVAANKAFAGLDKMLAHSPATLDAVSPNGEWHTRTMEAMKKKTEAQLKYIIKDATEAAEIGEKMGNPKAGQYRDEAHYAQMELKRRQDEIKKLKGKALDSAEPTFVNPFRAAAVK